MKRSSTAPKEGFISIQLSPDELKVLTSLASDQIFRREFIDPKMPGHRAKPAELSLGKELVARLEGILHPKQTMGALAGRASK